MKVLVVGAGAREHALCWKFSRSNRLSGLYAAPGNAGTNAIATNLPDLIPTEVETLTRFCVDARISLVFVGPEAPLAAGLVDQLEQNGISAIGPNAAASRLESSKSFAKEFMSHYGVPTAAYQSFSDADAFERHVRDSGFRLVVKKSGLAGGKGVLESEDTEELVAFGRAVIAEGDTVVAEEFLSGFEVSIFALTDGEHHILLPPCADYKKAGPGNTGPNTGGMGAICPVPWLSAEDSQRITDEVVSRTFAGIRDAGLKYRGVLYFGLMVTEEGPRLLEYNIRLGDPEAQVLLPLLGSDFTNWCDAVVNGSLDSFHPSYREASAVGVVVAAAGYPGPYEKGLAVSALPEAPDDNSLVFHAATTLDRDTVRTSAGRCFTAVGLGRDLLAARSRAYATARDIVFPGAWLRPDIGGRIFGG